MIYLTPFRYQCQFLPSSCQRYKYSIQMQLIKIIDHFRLEINSDNYQQNNMSKGFATAEQIEAQLQTKIRQMEDHQRNGNYVQAETCRINVEQLKKDYESRRLYELQQKHKQQNSDLARTHDQQLEQFNKFWDKKMDEHQNQGRRLEKEMNDRHELEQRNTRDQLDKQLPIKLKQSSELLNLRKMEEHMAKQKNYVEAQKVKDRCSLMQKQQKQAWINSRNLKIETALNKLRHKQQAQLTALQKKIKTGLDEQTKDRGIQQNRLRLKYSNVCKELKMQQDKQILSHKGQFKSKGGSTASPALSKSKTGWK